jgi:hypothetical protein
MCRKHHGAPFATHVLAPAVGFRWQGEPPALLELSSSATRVRRSCAACGSVAPTLIDDRVLLPAGNLLGELTDLPGLHMFVASKAPWHVIADRLPQHQGAPPGWPWPELHQPAPVQPAPVQLEGAAHGACPCGAVSFAISGAPIRWVNCHCSRCRRGRSAAHASNAFYPAAQFQWRTGRDLVRSYKPPEAERFTVSFCVRCGGGAPVERDNVPFTLIPTALLQGNAGAGPTSHIHVTSKAPWYPISDSLQQYPELPPG